ncbi:MAG: LexA family transcriptional regulator [Betaproteobacteria bacterium]|nr:LexA family transcriptional regulator [Betaproteobacteria bacterium]
MPPLSQDHDYLGRLQDYFAAYRSLPSFSHMARLLGLRSVASAHAVAGRFKLAGFLQATPDRRLAPGPRFFERPVADSVRAGLPAAANDAQAEMLTIDEFLIEAPSRTLLLTVKGDSMIEAGLQPGDFVIVDKGRNARHGDIVVAIVDNEFTLKYLDRDKRGIFLRAGNPAYGPIRPQGQLEIFGVVTGSFRKYA